MTRSERIEAAARALLADIDDPDGPTVVTCVFCNGGLYKFCRIPCTCAGGVSMDEFRASLAEEP